MKVVFLMAMAAIVIANMVNGRKSSRPSKPAPPSAADVGFTVALGVAAVAAGGAGFYLLTRKPPPSRGPSVAAPTPVGPDPVGPPGPDAARLPGERPA